MEEHDIDYYHVEVAEEDQVTMPALEVEVRLANEFKDNEEIEQQVRGIIPNLVYTRTHNSQFHRTLELYWHNKTIVALHAA